MPILVLQNSDILRNLSKGRCVIKICQTCINDRTFTLDTFHRKIFIICFSAPPAESVDKIMQPVASPWWLANRSMSPYFLTTQRRPGISAVMLSKLLAYSFPEFASVNHSCSVALLKTRITAEKCSYVKNKLFWITKKSSNSFRKQKIFIWSKIPVMPWTQFVSGNVRLHKLNGIVTSRHLDAI